MGASGDESSSSSSSSDTLLVRKKRLQQGSITMQKKSVNKNPILSSLCEVCEAKINSDTNVLACTGACRRRYHLACLPNETHSSTWQCLECRSNRHRCFFCQPYLGSPPLEPKLVPKGTDEKSTIECRAAGCGKFYHVSCVKKLPLTRVLGDLAFICPLHTCAKCEGNHNPSSSAQATARCTRCPTAFHTSCLPSSGTSYI
jgi:hypothetical protein